MEKYPTIVKFDREDLDAKISGIKSAEAKHAELEIELFELTKQKFDIEKQLGIKSEEPTPPYRLSNEISEWKLRQKDLVIEKVDKLQEFGQKGTIEYRDHESDEGVFDTNGIIKYETNEGVICIASIAHHERTGWSGTKSEVRTESILCAPDIDFPLKSKYASTETLETFGRTTWSEADYAVGDLLKALRWRRAVEKMSNLIDEKGALVILEGREPRFNKDIKRVKLEDETETWMIQLGDRWQSYNDNEQEIPAPLRAVYENKIIDQGFDIRIEQNNIRPYIWGDSGRAVTHDNHMDYVEKVIDRIEELGV